jgi:hypothetical protein
MPLVPMSLGGKLLQANGLPEFVGHNTIHSTVVSVFGPRGWATPIDYGDVFPNELGRPKPGAVLRFSEDEKEPDHIFCPN